MTGGAQAAGELVTQGAVARVTAVQVDVDFVVIALVLMVLAFSAFMAIWGVWRGSGARIDGVERKVDDAVARLTEVERQIGNLPTVRDIHALDVRVERVETVVDATSRQVDRILDHLMTNALRAAEEGAR